MNSAPITIQANINAPIQKVWTYWTEPAHITQWAFASDTWEAPYAANDLHVGHQFTTTMSAKDKSQSFNFSGTYTAISKHKRIEYDLTDGRHVKTVFESSPKGTQIIQTFDPESENTRKLQQQGWQAILNNFKRYVESS